MRRNQLRYSWLLTSISESRLGHVSRCVSSADIWSVLEKLFQSQSKARVMNLRLQLQTLKKGDLSVDDYILKMRNIADSIHAAGQTISEDDLILYVLGGFGSEYDSVVVNLTSRTENLTLQDVQFALQMHEMRLQQQSQSHSTAFGTTSSTNVVMRNNSGRNFVVTGTQGGFNSRNRGRGKYSNTKKPSCQLCGKPNHTAAKCYRRFNISFVSLEPTSEPSQQQANLVSSTAYQSHYASGASSSGTSAVDFPSSSGTTDWFMDSGATNHVTADLQNLSIQSNYRGKDKLAVGQKYSSGASANLISLT